MAPGGVLHDTERDYQQRSAVVKVVVEGMTSSFRKTHLVSTKHWAANSSDIRRVSYLFLNFNLLIRDSRSIVQSLSLVQLQQKRADKLNDQSECSHCQTLMRYMYQ